MRLFPRIITTAFTASTLSSTKHHLLNHHRSVLTMTTVPSSSFTDDRALQVGLTGSIGMGKSTISNHFKAMGFPVFDADATVHALYSVNGAAVEPIRKLFPDAIIDGAVSRPVLGKKIMESSTVLTVLEGIVHPLVAAERRQFYEQANLAGNFMVIYDIPLLLENPTSQEVDYVLVATASAATQKQRVLDRPGMTEEKFVTILSKQMPDDEKRKRANFLINTDFPSLAPARAQVASIVETLVMKHENRWMTWKNRILTESILQESQSQSQPQESQPQQSQQSQPQQSQPQQPQQTQPQQTQQGDTILSDAYDLVVFDLDDTLVPVWHPIKPATEALLAYMTQHMPRAAVDAADRLRPAMVQISADHPLMAHDLTEVRKEALRRLAEPHGEEGAVDEAIKLFVTIRSNVAPHLYEDVLPCLEWLKSTVGVRLAVLTNGNAMDLTVCTVLGQYVSLSLGAGDIGTLKPSPVPFMAISQRTGVPPGRILFVGDSYEKDVLGAQAVGMTGALLLRDGAPVPEGVTEDMVVLRSLQPDEVERQVRAHLLSKGKAKSR